MWRHPSVEVDESGPVLQALLSHHVSEGNLPPSCDCDELLAQPPAQPCMMHNLQGVISHHARHMPDRGLLAVRDKLAHVLSLLEPVATQRGEHAQHTASQLAVDLRWAKKCAEEMLGAPGPPPPAVCHDPRGAPDDRMHALRMRACDGGGPCAAQSEEERGCTMCSALSRDPVVMQTELQRLDAAMDRAVTEFSVVLHMTASLNPSLYYTTAATMTSLLNLPAADVRAARPCPVHACCSVASAGCAGFWLMGRRRRAHAWWAAPPALDARVPGGEGLCCVSHSEAQGVW